jgi:hypothetical protein
MDDDNSADDYSSQSKQEAYAKALDYAKKSAEVISETVYSNLLRKAEPAEFDLDHFRGLFPSFNLFLDKCVELELNLMVSGSSVLNSSWVTRSSGISSIGYWKPIDVDIYIHATSDQQQTLKAIDCIIRNLYTGQQIKLFRTPYILTWFIIAEVPIADASRFPRRELSSFLETNPDDANNTTKKNAVLASYQIIMSPCLRWEHVFAGYHTDMVCAGYLTRQQTFVISTRFDNWQSRLKALVPGFLGEGLYRLSANACAGCFSNNDPDLTTAIYENVFRYRSTYLGELDSKMITRESLEATIASVSYFFPDLVSPRYRDRVVNACEKYLRRGYACVLVEPTDNLFLPDVERSGDEAKITHLAGNYLCDAAIHISNLGDIEGYGNALEDVYQGETFATIIETMSCFRKCPGGCHRYVIGLKDSPAGYFCADCHDLEKRKITELESILTEYGGGEHTMSALVTGARCGLGQKLKQFFEKHRWLTYGTTRFPNLTDEKNMLELDLKDIDNHGEVLKRLERGEINVLVLSASETLHYPNDDSNKGKSKDQLEFDWTNDFQRQNSGIWHKTLDQHSQEEIISPLLTNVAGTARLLASFIKGVKRVRALESVSLHSSGSITKEKSFVCIVVTSFEGRFEEKTPFHPITNACKAALEQIVWTVQAQAKFLNCSIVLSDPGWVYTETAFGKAKGPVPIAYGVSQILEPLVTTLRERSGYKIYRREYTPSPNLRWEPAAAKSVTLEFKPCGCLFKFNNVAQKFMDSCPKCGSRITSRDVFDPKFRVTFILVAQRYKLPTDLIKMILRLAETREILKILPVVGDAYNRYYKGMIVLPSHPDRIE